MHVDTLGNRNNPAMILIPGMFCTGEMPAVIGKYFEKDYYVILPTLDGHYKEQPAYISKQQDCQEMIKWLEENQISEICLLQGTSMGAEVALEIAAGLKIPVKHYLYDGGPFFHFPGFVRSIMAGKFMGLLKKAASGSDCEESQEALLKDPFIKKLGGDSLESYNGMLQSFAEIGRWMDRRSVRAIADTCYKCDLPDLSKEILSKTTFLFSEKEPARACEGRLRRKYAGAQFYIAKGYGHGGFQLQNPEGYAQYIRSLIESEQKGSKE